MKKSDIFTDAAGVEVIITDVVPALDPYQFVARTLDPADPGPRLYNEHGISGTGHPALNIPPPIPATGLFLSPKKEKTPEAKRGIHAALLQFSTVKWGKESQSLRFSIHPQAAAEAGWALEAPLSFEISGLTGAIFHDPEHTTRTSPLKASGKRGPNARRYVNFLLPPGMEEQVNLFEVADIAIKKGRIDFTITPRKHS